MVIFNSFLYVYQAGYKVYHGIPQSTGLSSHFPRAVGVFFVHPASPFPSTRPGRQAAWHMHGIESIANGGLQSSVQDHPEASEDS